MSILWKFSWHSLLKTIEMAVKLTMRLKTNSYIYVIFLLNCNKIIKKHYKTYTNFKFSYIIKTKNYKWRA